MVGCGFARAVLLVALGSAACGESLGGRPSHAGAGRGDAGAAAAGGARGQTVDGAAIPDTDGTGGGAGVSATFTRLGLPSTSTACSQGATDPVARALCTRPAPHVDGLMALYRTLGLETFLGQRLSAATTHSVALGGRLVSALNPRVFVFSSYAKNHGHDLALDDIAAAAFTRGEQAVELVAYDPKAGELNFYLLVFEQPCNGTRCTPAQLFGAAIEDGWTGWQLYVDRDLEDTPFDCLSCHRPDGAGAPKRFLMREFDVPWMHWSGFDSFNPARRCSGSPLPPGSASLPDLDIVADDLRLLGQLGTSAAPAAYAGVPFEELWSTASGHDFSSFLTIAVITIDRGITEMLLRRAEPMMFDSEQVLCEGSVGRTDTWRAYRTSMLARGFPVPFHGLDVLDPEQRSPAAADFAGYLARRSDDDAYHVAARLMHDDAEQAIGFVPSPSDDARTILRQMCIRCHDAATDPRLRRARFNAEKLDEITPDAAALIWKRITAPRSAPELMPPLRAGELPPWAIDRIATFLDLQDVGEHAPAANAPAP